MKQVNIKTIRENPDNPRTISDYNFESLKRSILDFPEMLKLRPIIIDEKGTILGGNMRYKAALDLGIENVWVDEVFLTENQKKEFIIKDNTSYGEWNFHDLQYNYGSDELKEWGLDIPEWYTHQTDIETHDLNDNEKHGFGWETITLKFTLKDYDDIMLTMKEKGTNLNDHLRNILL